MNHPPRILCLGDNDNRLCFDKVEELKEYVETRHAEEGGFDWISEINDGKGKYYGCNWIVEIEQIG